MSGKRNYWSKMNHAEARNAVELMSDAEAGRWLRGWLEGASGAESEQPSIEMEWRMGFCAGKASFVDAQEYSQKQADRVSHRYTKATTVDPVEETLPEVTTEYHELPELPITQQTNKQTNKAKSTRFIPPSEQEWIAYCTVTWPDWHPTCSGESWAHYEGVNWKGKSDWKSVARTAHGNARSWGKLQPLQQRGAWTPPAPTAMTYTPGELDGIDPESLARL